MNSRAGFSLPVVIMSVGVAAVAAAVVLDVIGVDLSIGGSQRRNIETRLQAEGGLMELMNDQRLLNALPDYGSDRLSTEIEAAPDSLFTEASDETYRAEVRLLRLAPLLESSQGKLQAIMYELVVDAERGSRDRAGVRAEIYKFTSRNSGLIQEGRHAR